MIHSLLHATTHEGSEADPTTLPLLITKRHNFARVVANLPALSLEKVRETPLLISVDASALDPHFTTEDSIKDPAIVVERLASALEAIVACCRSTWTFELIIDMVPNSTALVPYISSAFEARGLSKNCCVVPAAPGSSGVVSAARQAIQDPRRRVVLTAAKQSCEVIGASLIYIRCEKAPGKMQLVENRATMLYTWDRREPSSYDAAVLCGGGRSTTHPKGCFMLHYGAGMGEAGMFNAGDVKCDVCKRKLDDSAPHDYFLCLPCNWATCAPCFRAADHVMDAGERSPPPVITKVPLKYADALKTVRFDTATSQPLDGDAVVSGKHGDVVLRACAVCKAVCAPGGAPLQHCGRCFRIMYCSPVCQRIDWKQHKSVCRTFVEEK